MLMLQVATNAVGKQNRRPAIDDLAAQWHGVCNSREEEFSGRRVGWSMRMGLSQMPEMCGHCWI